MIVYISTRFETNLGARVHRSILGDLYGEENVFTFDMRPIGAKREPGYICFGKYKNRPDRVKRWMQGNSMYISNRIIDEICSLIEQEKAELVFFENTEFGTLIREIKRRSPQVRTVCFYHDINADLYRQWLGHSNFVGKIEARIGIRQEKVAQKYSDVDLVFNRRSAELYKRYYGEEPDFAVPLSAYPAALPDAFLRREPALPDEKKKLLFVGTKYYPNVEGIRWFYKNVLPGLDDRVELEIVGRGTEFLAEEFPDPRVCVRGTVDDLAEYYFHADIVIAPLFSGGGMKTKSIEAISFGKCLIGNEESLVGIWEETDETVRDRLIFHCDTADDWISAIRRLSGEVIYKFNRELYDLFSEKFSYDSVKTRFAEILFRGKEQEL